VQINEVHVEAGAMLNGALLQAGLIDELLMYVAPRVIGSGFSVANFGAHAALDDLMQAGHWRWLETQQVGNDLRLRAQKITEYK
jgi:diaminohydroxyphosphoribosylaminopyrimidine deaminase/5-amino-6-(5-phosphoribosylamino)uracil reductase